MRAVVISGLLGTALALASCDDGDSTPPEPDRVVGNELNCDFRDGTDGFRIVSFTGSDVYANKDYSGGAPRP